MNAIQKFNALNKKKVSRAELDAIYNQAQQEQYLYVAQRIEKVLQDKKATHFYIKINDFENESGLSGVEQKILLPALQYQSDQDNQGLNGVSPNEIYNLITDLIITTIKEVGHLPWQKEWTGSGSAEIARNYVSEKEYTGANFLLNFDVKFNKEGKPYLVPINFIEPYYLTFNQIKDAGAELKKGSKARQVIYYTILWDYRGETLKFKTTDKKKFIAFAKEHKLTKEDFNKYLFKIPIVRYYNVYRADHCKGLPSKAIKINTNSTPIEQAQDIIDGYKNPPKYTFNGDKAYYMPSTDTVNMPKIEAFNHESAYYCTYFHEMIHSTGHSKRLGRGNDTRVRDGSSQDIKAYAFEELIAELGAVFLCAESGILFHTKENSAKYLKGWNDRLIENLQDDNRFFLKASAQAQKAVNHILDNETKDAEFEVFEKKKNKSNNPKNVFLVVKRDKTKKIGLAVSAISKVPKKEIDHSKDKSINQLQKLGFISADCAPQQAKDVFTLGGEIGKFLQKQQPYKALILIKGNKHSSKSQLAMQIANAFAEQKTTVAYIDYEQGGIESKDTLDSINRNTSPEARKYIAVKGYLEKPFEELQEFCKVVKVIIADSVTDLKITADQLNFLRTQYPKIIWCFISQVKENGAMYGGNKMAHNPTCVIHCSSNPDPKQRFAILEKNRGNDLEIKYSMYYKKVIQESKNKSPKGKLSFVKN